MITLDFNEWEFEVYWTVSNVGASDNNKWILRALRNHLSQLFVYRLVDTVRLNSSTYTSWAELPPRPPSVAS